jgi:hypothetical protein
MSMRFWIAASLVFAAALNAASGQVTDSEHCAAKARPSTLDYLALASMADSQRPLAMAAYRPQRQSLPLPDEPQLD